MPAPYKTQAVSVLSHQAVTHPGTVKSAAIDVSTKISAMIHCFHASVEATINTNPGKFLIQVSAAASGDEDWITAYEVTATESTADDEPMTATEPAGETILAVADTTGFVAGDILYIQDTGTLINSEWNRCQRIVTNTSINLIDGLTNQKDSSDIVRNDADVTAVYINLESVGRLRVVFQHEGAIGADCHIKALMTTFDSFS